MQTMRIRDLTIQECPNTSVFAQNQWYYFMPHYLKEKAIAQLPVGEFWYLVLIWWLMVWEADL